MTHPPLPSPLCVCSQEYARACQVARIPGGSAGAIERYRVLYRDGRVDQPHLRILPPRLGRVHESESSEGTVRKFTLGLDPKPDDARRSAPGAELETESVIIPMIGRKGVLTHTLCVSSQIGCAMGCVFCQTAQMGLIRQLTPDEIVAQWWAARHLIPGDQVARSQSVDRFSEPGGRSPGAASSSSSGCSTIRNVVFMGMGEPMDNLDNVLGAIAILTDHNAVALPMSKITISTVGRLDGIARLAAHIRTPGWHRLNLAISLNAPNDDIRSRIMPINKAMPMRDLRIELEAWPIYGAAKMCLEYVLIPGVNDQQAHAAELGDFVLGRAHYAGHPALPGLVNVIPYNPREHSPWDAPSEHSVDQFLQWLLDTGVYAKRRRTKGRDQMAACGQLGNPALRKPRPVQLTARGAAQ